MKDYIYALRERTLIAFWLWVIATIFAFVQHPMLQFLGAIASLANLVFFLIVFFSIVFGAKKFLK